ncbi:serine/threonine-protein phosphatase 2A regulatory subunit B'' subunit gamma-like [Mixophyes fleayi]|uniref:serine/threonine-protein phosphatase 2A regulatory subunit B'' subunit gamma-like n=1 Tax=Mixophyes fleayi TaxID=3061075 RepID=UPI003F4E2E95
MAQGVSLQVMSLSCHVFLQVLGMPDTDKTWTLFLCVLWFLHRFSYITKFITFAIRFFLGKIKIQDILACSFLDDLLELRDEELSKESQESNWFSAPSALRVYGQYLNLDKDHNGMLSKEELSRYGTGTLTNIFLDRVFQECLTYDGEMDYKTYLDFVLALENRKEPAALQYIFKLLDIQNKGSLNVFSLNYFFRVCIYLQMSLKQH